MKDIFENSLGYKQKSYSYDKSVAEFNVNWNRETFAIYIFESMVNFIKADEFFQCISMSRVYTKDNLS